jgi:hypothetical protein
MPDPNRPADRYVAEILGPRRTSRFWGMGAPTYEAPTSAAGALLLLLRNQEAARSLSAAPLENLQSPPDGATRFACVSTAPHPLDLTFTATDAHGRRIDMVLGGTWLVSDPLAFLNAVGLDLVSPELPLAGPIVTTWIGHTIGHRVRDLLTEHAFDDLLHKEVLPPAWWQTQLNEWLAPFGLRTSLLAVRWESAEASRAETERRQQEDLARLQAERERQQQAELREAAAKAGYEREKARVEADIRTSQEEKKHRLLRLEKQHHKEMIEAETEIENARREAERIALQHELDVARMRQDLQGVGLTEQRQKEAEVRHHDALDRLAVTHQALDRIVAVAEPLLAALAGRDAQAAHQAAERLTSPEFGVSATALQALGYQVPRQALVQSLHQKARADGGPVVIQKEDLLTRDIGAAKVKALPIGRSLTFMFRTARPGYVTLMNIGTSGAVYVQVPNAWVGVRAAQAVAGRSYTVPGKDMFPWEGDYREEGPPGWEHMALVISDEPLVEETVLARSSHDCPIVRLTDAEVQNLSTALAEGSGDRWSAGVLSFLVSA